MYLVPLLILATPLSAEAQTLFQVVGLLNIFVGLLVVAAFVTFGTGLVYYLAHIELEKRIYGIYIMEWGVSIVFVTIVLLAIAKFVRDYTGVVIGVASVVTFLLFMLAVAYVLSTSGHAKEKRG